MEQNPCEANSYSATQEITHFLWITKVHYCVYKRHHGWPYKKQI